jgi:hypothetical protein
MPHHMSAAPSKPPRIGTKVRVIRIDTGLLASLQGEELALAKSMVGQVYPVVEVQASGHVVVEASAVASAGHSLVQSLALAPSEFELVSHAA